VNPTDWARDTEVKAVVLTPLTLVELLLLGPRLQASMSSLVVLIEVRMLINILDEEGVPVLLIALSCGV